MFKMKKTTKVSWVILIVGLIPLIIMNEMLVSRDVDSTLRIAFAAFYYISLKGISFIIIRRMDIKEDAAEQQKVEEQTEETEQATEKKDQP
ncbi:hypothetical protein [Aliamphritea spongicola]|uniref:hypothetical protein n=1 Tax=Aliamphritea spongicola TaxID=707589 RepID=UPI00196AA4CE|nr:hypothetical protein [Aliamphritea spongicola]MBN3563923.1 hypothetical protein [Aliamphritea spongicola]